MSLLLLAFHFITDNTGATTQVTATIRDLEKNMKDPGKLYRHTIKSIYYNMYNPLFIYTLWIKLIIKSTSHSIFIIFSFLIYKKCYVDCVHFLYFIIIFYKH